MNLRTEESPWIDRRSTPLGLGRLAKDEACDVLVVGSGITGALTAFHLAEAGHDVVVVDTRSLASGSTPASTALIQYELDVPLVDLIPTLGLADAQAVYRATRNALDDMRELIERNGFDCGFTQRPTLYLAKEQEDVLHLQHEALARSQIGIEASWIDAKALDSRYGMKAEGAIRSAVSFEMDPQALTEQLLYAACERGVRLYDRTKLSTDPWVGSVPTLRTEDGYSIHTRQLVYATGYETPQQFPALQPLCKMKTTFALATTPRSPDRLWPERALIWEHASPYLYARTAQDGRIILGGEDVPLVPPEERDALLPKKTDKLLKRFADLTGMNDLDVDQTWAGTFAETIDGLPFVGSPDCANNCYFILGFGGNGILFGLMGAQIIRDVLQRQRHPAERLFAFDRPSVPQSLRGVDLTCP